MFFKSIIHQLKVGLALFLLLVSYAVKAQIMPVGVSVVMNPPSSPFLADYYSLGSTAFQAYVTLNDLNEPSWNVRLIVRIEGQGIVIETKKAFLPAQPINLVSGVPLLIAGADLAPYLNVNNVNLQGITPATLNQNGKLPEGTYQFCVQVLDYQSGIPLSFKNCGSAFIFYENPPVLLVPTCETAIQPCDPQNIFFNWQMAGGASPNIAATSQYKLFLYELQDENENPYFAVQNNKALLIYESDFVQSTSQTIDFGLTNSAPLIPGKRYIYRVRALDAEGKNIYKNDGFSEFCWFFYGYPEGGNLVINAPNDAHIFTKSENKSFSWATSDKVVQGQEFEYVLVIKEKNPGQTSEQAMDNNPVWFSVNQPATSSLNGGDFLLTQELDPGKNYVWQVKALTATQQVAQSQIREFYSPSVIDQFFAGNFPIQIVTISNFTKNGATYSNVSGKGRVQLSADPLDVLDADFTGLTIEDFAGTMILTQGSFTLDLTNRAAKELQPTLPENGTAQFYYNSGTVNSSGLSINGRIEWPFPHATNSNVLEFVKSKTVSFQLNSTYALSGSAAIDAPKDYHLLEPHELVVSLDASTQLTLFANNYSLKLNGNILTNDDVRTNNASPYAIKIVDQPQLYYFNAANLQVSATNYLAPIVGLNLGLMPKSAIIDLSEDVSPDKLATNAAWKGIYFPEFQVRFFKSQFDATNQVLLPSTIDYFEDLTQHEFWISNQGLQFNYQFSSNEAGIFFNKFKTEILGNIKITDNEVSNSFLKGAVKIPVVNENDLFTFEIPITTQGLQSGYLNEDLTQREIIFNPFGGENRVNLTINRAVFAANERLDLEVNAELVGFNTTITNISDFRIYGDNVVGIGSRNGSKKLDNRVSGTYKGFNAFITDVGAALFNGNYVFSYIAEMDLGEDVSGQNGPPLLSISSVSPVGSGVEMPAYSVSNPQPEPAIPVPPDSAIASSQTITAIDMFISINNSVVDISGYLKLRANDPVWGNSFSGGINGQVKLPTVIEAGANMILGDRNGVKFWYFDAWFNDRQGQGLKVGSLFNITAFEGRIFHHMSKSQGQFTVDPTMAFGGAIFLQIIDPSGGKMFASDIGAELKVFEDGEFTLSMSGKASILNQNSRTAGTGGVAAAVGEAVVEQAIESVGPLSLSLQVAGGSLTVEAQNLKAGSLQFTKSDYTVGLSADVSSNPKVGFNFAKGTTSFNVNASAAGEFGLGVGLGSDHVNLGLSGTNGGYLNLSLSGASLAADINRQNRTGNFHFDYDGKEVGLGVTQTTGYLKLKLSPTRGFDAGFSTAGAAFIGLKFDNNSFKLAGNKVTKSGSLNITSGGLQMAVSANALEKSASFLLTTSGVSLNLAGKKGVGGNFNLNTSSFGVNIAADIPSKTGALGFSFDGGNKAFNASLDGGTEGKISFKNGSQEFGIGGNADGSAGSVSYKDGTNEFSVAADRTAKTGSLVLKMGGDGIQSSIAPDTASVAFKYSNYTFDAGIAASGSGGLKFSDGSNSFGIYGNPAAKKGSFDLLFSGNHVALSTDIPNKKHSILVDASGFTLGGESSNTAVALSLAYQNHVVNFAKSQSNASPTSIAGSVSYSDGTNNFALSADPAAATGSVTLNLNGNGASSSIGPDSSFVNFNYEGYAFSSGISANGAGTVRYSQPNNSFSITGNPTAQSGAVDLVFGSNHIALSSNIPTKVHSLDVQSAGVHFNAATSSSEKSLAVSYSGYGVYANKHTSDYEVGLTVNNRKIEGGKSGNIKRISYVGDGADVSLSSNKVALTYGGQTLEIIPTAVSVNGASVGNFVSGATASYTQSVGSISTTVNLNAGIYTLLFTLSGNQFKVTTSDFSNGALEVSINGNLVGLQKDNDNYALTVNDYSAAYESGIISLQKGNDKKLVAGGDSLSLAYEGYNLSVSTTSLNYSDGQNSGSLSSSGLALKRDQNEMYVGPTNFGLKMGSGKSLDLTRNSIHIVYDQFAAAYTAGSAISASYDNYSFAFANQKLSLSQGTSRKLEVSPSSLGVIFDGYSFNASPTAFDFTDGTNSAAIAQTGISLSRGSNTLFLNDTNFGVNIGASKHVYLTKSSLDVKYDNYLAAFSTSKSLSFSDGTHNFALSNAGLSMSDGNKSISVLDKNGKPAIKLVNGADNFELDQSGFAVEYAGKRYAVNENEYLNVNIDAQRHIEVLNNGLKYVEGDYQFILGGDDNYVELKDAARSFALSKDEKLIYTEGAYIASLSKNLAVEFSDGTRNITLLKDQHYLTYAQNGYSFGIRGAGGSKPGIDFSNSDYTFFVEGARNTDVTVGVTSAQFGTISASVNSAKDIKAKLSSGANSAYGFMVNNGKLELINGAETAPQPQNLAGAPSIPAQDGPAHLTNSIADEAGGSIKGEATLYFDSKNKHFMMTAAVAGTKPVCITGAMAMDVSPGQFHLDIGTEQQRVEIYPTCSGFGGGGWLGIHNTNVDLGAFFGWKAEASVKIGSNEIGARLTAKAGAELGVKANLNLDPFKINSAGVWVELYAGIYAKYWYPIDGGGSCTIAEASLKGELNLYFEDKTRITGSLEGRITVLEIITASFSMGFDTTI